MVFCYPDGKGFDFTGPDGPDARPDRGEGEAADPIEKASKREFYPITIPIPSVGETSAVRISCVLIRHVGMPSRSASCRSPSMPELIRELWPCGGRFSSGMEGERQLAGRLGIPICRMGTQAIRTDNLSPT